MAELEPVVGQEPVVRVVRSQVEAARHKRVVVARHKGELAEARQLKPEQEATP